MHMDRQDASAVRADASWRSILVPEAAAEEHLIASALTVFAHALSFELAGEQYTMLAQGGRPAPGVLLTDLRDFAGIEPGARITLGARSITIAGPRAVSVSLTHLDYYSCLVTPVADAHHFEVGEPPYSIDPPGLAAAIAQIAHPGSFVPSAQAGPFERAMTAQLNTAREHFRDALSSVPETSSLRTAAAGLIGLGIGLTPSGDDYLVGTLAMLSLHPGATSHREALAQAIHSLLSSEGGTELTTPSSRHYLRAACARRFQYDLAAAGRAALTGSHDLDSLLAAAAAVGSTSGSDALLGLSDAYALLAGIAPLSTTRAGDSGSRPRKNTL